MNPAFTQNMSYKSFLRFLVPSILSMVFVSFYTTVDGFFVARHVNSNAMAAINIIIPITCISFGLAVMMATGAGAIVGMRMGEGKKEEADGFFSFVFLSLVILSIVMTVLGLVFLDDILRLCGSTAVLDPYTKPYGYWTILMTPSVMIKLFLEYFARVDGNPKLAMSMSIWGLILNIILDYFFVVVLDFGISGAGIGTALSITISSMIGVVYFFSGRSHLTIRKPSIEIKGLFQACYNGCSEMFTEFSTGITTLLFNLALLRYSGENGVAAMSVITYLFYFFIAVYFGIAVGTQPLISYSYGANNGAKIKEVIRYSFSLITAGSIIVFLCSFLFAKQILGIFITEAVVMDIAVPGLKLFSMCFLLIGFNVFVSSYFTAVGRGSISAMISVSRAFIFVILYLPILSNAFGISGIWMTVPAAELTTIVLSLLFYKKKNVHQNMSNSTVVVE